MNIIYLSFTKGLAEVPEYLKKRLPSIGEVHLIVDKKEEIKTDCKNYLLTRNCQLGHYPDSNQYNNLSLDEGFLHLMSKCESEVLKMMDRYQFSGSLLTYEQRINLYHKELKYWYNYLVKERIDICFFAVIPHVVYDFIIYSLCKQLGIKIFMLYRLPVLPKKNVSIYVLDDIKTHISGLKASYEKYLKRGTELSLSPRMEAYLELKSGNQNKTFSGIVSRNRDYKKYFQIKKYINYIKYYTAWSRDWMKLWGAPIDIMYRFVYNISKSRLVKPVFVDVPDLNCKYVLVSLHYQPECTTSPMGGVFVHQDLMVDMLQKSVPEDVKIYIKAHPREGMNKVLYKRIQVDSRTVFINPNLNSFLLIINSLAVATVTGTTGWEGFINKKPVMMFGNYFYQDAPGVYKIKSLNDAINALSEISDKKNIITDDMIKAFLKAVEENSFPGWVDSRYSVLSGLSDHQNCTNIADALATAIRS